MQSVHSVSNNGSLVDLACIERAPVDLPDSVSGCLIRRRKDFEDTQSIRKNEFRDGRNCAQIALSLKRCDETVGTGSDRCPIWPDGFIGSISHSDRYAWSVVARKTELQSIGIDTEPIAEAKTIQQLRYEIGNDSEWSLAESFGLTSAAAFTTVFSAKESLFKCIYPLNPVFFGFGHVCLIDIDAKVLTFQFQPDCPNSCFANDKLTVAYSLVDNDVFTACWIESVRGGIR